MGKINIISYSSQAFKDRQEAGRLLGLAIKNQLKWPAGKPTVVLGIPRGGLVVASEIASVMCSELDIVLSRKLGAPHNKELAIGAVLEDGKIFLNEDAVRAAGASKSYIEKEKSIQLADISRRVELYRSIREKEPLSNRTVIVVDDGIATGATLLSSLWAARKEAPGKLIAAVPVAAQESLAKVAEYADEVVALRVPEYLGAVGQFYANFQQVSDEEVLQILQQAGKKPCRHFPSLQ